MVGETKERKEKNNEQPLSEDFLKSRSIIISEPISAKLAQSVIQQVILLNQKNAKEAIYIYINSPGGCADSGFAIYDILRFFPNPIITICSGLCASAAVMVFLAADKGKNFSLPNSRFLIHQPSTQIQGTASDIEITADQINKIHKRYNQVISDTTKKTVATITKNANRDFWLDSQEAFKYGLVHKVIKNLKESKSK